MKSYFYIWKLNVLSLMAYKTSFLFQTIFMVINNTLLISVWYMFFLKFDTIWWINFWEYMILLSIMVLVFALIHIFWWGFTKLGIMIEEWKLDAELLLPKNMLFRILVSQMPLSIFWDFIYAYLLMLFIPNLTFLMLIKITLVAILWSITFLWFMIFFHSLTFFIWSTRWIVRWIFEAILSPSLYPPWIYEWTILKFIFMTVIPVSFVVFIPFELVRAFEFRSLIYLTLGSLWFFSLWVFTFFKGLKRYESGNIMNVNV